MNETRGTLPPKSCIGRDLLPRTSINGQLLHPLPGAAALKANACTATGEAVVLRYLCTQQELQSGTYGLTFRVPTCLGQGLALRQQGRVGYGDPYCAAFFAGFIL